MDQRAEEAASEEEFDPSFSSDESEDGKSVNSSPPKAKAKTKDPVRSITERTRLKCMSKLYDQNTTPNTRKHCKKLFEGIVGNNTVVTTAIQDLGSMGVLSQDIVERTKLFIPNTPPTSSED